MVIDRVILPSPSSRTPSRSPDANPAEISIASVIGCSPSILPDTIAASSAPRFTGAYSLRK